jgi:hypothetical protein
MKYEIGSTYRLPFGQCRRELLATFAYNGTTRYQFNLLGGERKALVSYTASDLDRVNPLVIELTEDMAANVQASAHVQIKVVPFVSLYHPSMVEVRKIA